jgi:hypothetical protein
MNPEAGSSGLRHQDQRYGAEASGLVAMRGTERGGAAAFRALLFGFCAHRHLDLS